MSVSRMKTQMVALDAITVADRIRKENGDIAVLAQSIRERGLINPITVMEQTDGGYVLIAGLRRLKAVRSLGEMEIRATVLSAMEADEALMLEIAENEQRQEFTMAERLAYAERIKAVEREKALARMSLYARAGYKDGQGTGDCPYPDKGESRDIIAEKAGFSSSRQMRRAKVVADKRPDLLDKVDRKEMTITGAYEEIKHSADAPLKLNSAKEPPMIVERRVEVEPLRPFNPLTVELPSGKSGLEGARHEQLMNNPVYQQLFQHYQEALQQANLARGELRTCCEGYERRIRAYEENADAMRREIAKLKEGQSAGT